jgi:ketosteroid isomerase-like protein
MSARARLFVLLAVVAGLAIVRLAHRPPPSDTAPVATAIVRDRTAMHSADVGSRATPSTAAERAWDDGEDAGTSANPFAVRSTPLMRQAVLPPVLRAQATAPSMQTLAVVMPPISPPPIADPPFRVIGTYEDGDGRGVFVATTAGTVLARDGSLLDEDHHVESIAAQQVVVKRISKQSLVHLPIPVGVSR